MLATDSESDEEKLASVEDIKERNKLKKKLVKVQKRLVGLQEESYDAMAEQLKERATRRGGWERRVRDSVFSTVDLEFRPVPPPLFSALAESTLPVSERDLNLLADEVLNLKAKYLQKQ